MKKNLLTLSVAILMASSLSANASLLSRSKQVLHTKIPEALTDPRYEIKSIAIHELTAEEALEFAHDKIRNKDLTAISAGPATPSPAPRGALDSIIMVVDKLVAIGQKIMPAIEKGRPVVTNNPMTAVSVLPKGDGKDFVVQNMGGWTIPVQRHYKIVFTNGLGAEVVNFIYSISFQYNGSVDGKGKYLSGIRASARNITVDWGFDLDASSQLIAISNVGTQANPIAGATLEMSYTVKNWTRTLTTNTSFHVTGDGRIFKLD